MGVGLAIWAMFLAPVAFVAAIFVAGLITLRLPTPFAQQSLRADLFRVPVFLVFLAVVFVVFLAVLVALATWSGL
jgi:hypothetical protein